MVEKGFFEGGEGGEFLLVEGREALGFGFQFPRVIDKALLRSQVGQRNLEFFDLAASQVRNC